MSTTIFPNITWLNDEDIIEILSTIRSLRLQCESNEEFNKKENNFIECISNFSKKNSKYIASGKQLKMSILDSYGRIKMDVLIERSIHCCIEAKIFYRLNELDSGPVSLSIRSLREDIIRENEILFSLVGNYDVMINKEPISLGHPITYKGEKIKISFLQKLKMLAS